MLRIVVVALAAYLVGSIPWGHIVAGLRGVDLRKTGSGNVGATNVYRALGLQLAVFVFILDVSKGYIAARVLPLLWMPETAPGYISVICGIAAILGSVVSVYMRFRGGKGVAAAVGVFLGLAPLATAICLGVWVILFARFGYVSLGSIVGAAALPVLVAILGPRPLERPIFFLALAVAAIVVIRHRANIGRLMAGTENRIGAGKGETR